MTPQAIEAEYWAYEYEENKSGIEFENDDENAHSDYLAAIIAEGEAAEAEAAAAAAARGEQPEPVETVATRVIEGPVAKEEVDLDDWGPEE